MAGSAQLTRRGHTLLGAAAGLYVGGWALGAVELTVLGVAAVVLLVAGWLLVRNRRLHLGAHRTVQPARLHAGGDGRVELAVVNHGTRPTPVVAAEEPFAGGRRRARLLLPALEPDEEGRVEYQLPALGRGRHTVGPLTVTVSDPFGLVERTDEVLGTDELLVLPRVHDVVGPVDAGGMRAAAEAARTVGGRAETAGDDFYSLREYEVGDDLRRVHWRSTARAGVLMVRQDEPWRRSRATVLLDTRRAAHDPASFELAVEAAASVVTCLVRLHRRVEVVTATGESLGESEARTGGALLERLAVVRADAADRLAAVAADLRVRRHPGVLVAVLGQVRAEELDALSPEHRQDGVVTVVLTRAGSGGPAAATRRRGLVVVDATREPFPRAWNEACLRWKTVAVPSWPVSRSSR